MNAVSKLFIAACTFIGLASSAFALESRPARAQEHIDEQLTRELQRETHQAVNQAQREDKRVENLEVRELRRDLRKLPRQERLLVKDLIVLDALGLI
jgi:hypothetical protein